MTRQIATAAARSGLPEPSQARGPAAQISPHATHKVPRINQIRITA